MLKLTKKTDYALMALNYMSDREQAFVANTRNIADTYNIPPELLAKVLQKLAKEGMINSQNGPKGGYSLVRDPSEITLGEIIRVIEGPIQIVRCGDGDNTCEQTEQCTIRSPLRRIERQIIGFLDSITIDKICREPVEEVVAIQ